MPLIWAAVIGAAGSAISGAASASSERKTAQAKLDADRESAEARVEAQNRLLGSLQSGNFGSEYGGGYSAADVFGSPRTAVPATDIPYEISANNKQVLKQGVPNANEAASLINRQVTADALISGFDRARALDKNYDANTDQISDNIFNNLRGNLSPDVVQSIASNRASIGAGIGTPGGTGPATSKDLGLTSLELQNRGASMYSQFHNTLTQISPVQQTRGGDQLLPYTSLTAQGRIDSSIQNQIAQQNYETILAEPDPTASGLFNAQYAQANQAGQLINNQAPNNFGNAIAGGIGQGISAYGNAYSQQQITAQNRQADFENNQQLARIYSGNYNY